jgi:hypothetical protein
MVLLSSVKHYLRGYSFQNPYLKLLSHIPLHNDLSERKVNRYVFS